VIAPTFYSVTVDLGQRNRLTKSLTNRIINYCKELINAGKLPRRQERFVEAWAELHQKELLENWERLQKGQPPVKIVPLQ
jgi:uncharacterized protein YbcC (UPF0753/DUF2309 family)